jgi:hypothetical protein
MNPHIWDSQWRRVQAEIANEQFLISLYRYGARHGLPNISRSDCRRYSSLLEDGVFAQFRQRA